MFIDGEGQSFAALVQSGIGIETPTNGIDNSKLTPTPFLCERVKMTFSWGCSGCIDNTAVIWSKAERKVDT